MESESKVLQTLVLAFIMLLSTFAVADSDGDPDRPLVTGSINTGVSVNAGVSLDDNSSTGTEDDDEDGAEDDESNDDSRRRQEGNSGLVRPLVTDAVARDRIESARENYEASRERYMEAKERYEEARRNAVQNASDFNALRERVRNAESEDKNRLRAELKVKAQHTLLNQVNAILHHLEAIKEKEVAPDDVNELMAFFEEKKGILEGDEVTQEMLVEISAEIREFWREHRLGVKQAVGFKLNARINALVEKAENFSERLSSIIAELEAEGKDVSLLKRGLNKLDSDIEKFKSAYERLRALYSEADTNEGMDSVLAKGHRLLKAMNDQLSKDFRLMRALFKATRELSASAEASAGAGADVEALIASSEVETEFDLAIDALAEVAVNE